MAARSPQSEANALYARAHRLYLEQREARGWVRAKTLEGKPCKLIGPYVPTEENQIRAATILYLRRKAGCIQGAKALR